MKKLVSQVLLLAFLISILSPSFLTNASYAAENGTHGASLNIVENGAAGAVIVLPDSNNSTLQAAANLLVKYIQKSTGAVLQIKKNAEVTGAPTTYAGLTKIYVGFIAAGSDPAIQSELDSLSTRDGYLIRPYGDGITIIGASAWGTRFGVSDFLERYLGVYWLMPGEDGEYVPSLQNVSVPLAPVKEEPVLSEGNYYVNGSVYEWSYANRRYSPANTEITFSHNLVNIFPPAEFASSHPEIYPIINGTRFIPRVGQVAAWQPRFTEPVTVDIAVQKIKAYFDANPEKMWFALGVNDSGGYDDEYIKGAPLNSVGLAHVSDIYYAWVNAVVERVVEDPKYQDKKFGLIAYDWVLDPPSFALNEHVVPFICKDRMAWIDDEVEGPGKSLNEGWAEKATTLGWYDYVYGGTYAVPRMYMGQMADNYRFAAEKGVKYIFSEVLPNWGEGPKYWMMSKLEWNPDLDVDDLMEQWCTMAVGSEAAGYLMQYYAYWENFWTHDIKNSTWFQTHKNRTYLHFYDASYLNAPTRQDMAVSRELLEEVLAKATGAKEKVRAQMLYRAFEYYEATVLSYPRTYAEIEDEETALSYLADDGDINNALTMSKKRYEIIDRELASTPSVLDRDPRYLPAMTWDGLNPSQFFAMSDYMRRKEPDGGVVTDRVKELAQSSVPSQVREFARLLLRAWQDDYINLDPSFESGQPGDLEAGGIWEPHIILGTNNSIKYDNRVAHTGNTSVRLDSIGEAGPAQKMPVNPGLTTVSLYYCSPAGTQTRGSMVVICDLYDENKNLLKADYAYTGRKMFRDAAGTWTRAELLFEVPKEVNGVPVKYMRVYMDAYQLDDGVPAYIDDVYVYQGVDTSRLDTVLASMDSFLANPGASHYTTASREILKAAVAHGKYLINERIADVSQEEIDSAAGRIDNAYQQLEFLPLLPEVKAYLSDLPYDENLSWAVTEGNQEEIYYNRNSVNAEFSVKVEGEPRTFEKGVGTKAPSRLYYDLTDKGFEQFETFAGIDLNSPVSTGIAYNMTMNGNNQFAEVDVTTGVKLFGEDKILTFKVSGNADGTSYLRTKNQAAAGQAPTLELTLSDGSSYSIVAEQNSQVQGGTYADDNAAANSAIHAQLVVSKSTNPVLMRSAFLKFDLSTYHLPAADIKTAKLKLYSVQSNSPTVQVTALSNDTWEPAVITWNNQPQGYSQEEIDADKGPVFRIYGDEKLLYDSGTAGNTNLNAAAISIPIMGVDNLRLEVDANGSILADKAVWADARFIAYTVLGTELSSVEITGGNTVEKGSTLQLSVSGLLVNNEPADLSEADITWASDNPGVAAVNAESGLVTAMEAGTASITAEVTLGSITTSGAIAITVTAPENTNPGNGGGGETGTAIPPAPVILYDKETSRVSTKIKAPVDPATGTAVARADAAIVAALLDKAAKEKAEIISIKVDVPGGTKAVDVVFPREAFNQIAGAEKIDVSVDAGSATVVFNDRAVENISSSAAEGNISIGLRQADKISLTEVQRRVGDRPVYDFTVKAGNTEVSEFGPGGKAEISISYALKPEEKKNSVVAYCIGNSGKLQTVRGKYDEASGTVKFTTTHFARYAVGYHEVNFSDVEGIRWYTEAISFMAAREYISGVGSGRFGISKNVSRADFLMMVMKSYGIEPDSNITDNFADAGDKYYTAYLATAKRLGLVSGTGSNKYAPEATISRQDMMVILYNILDKLEDLPDGNGGRALDGFADADRVAGYAVKAMELFAEKGITVGDGKNLNPGAVATREQAAQILYNLLTK